MPRFSTHVVSALVSERDGLQRVSLASGRRAYVLTDLVGPVAVGDSVVVNTTAVDLGLGTGGWDVVHWNLSRSSFDAPGPGHVMKVRYTSLQVDAGVAEEVAGYAAPPSLGGMPVVVCPLHSHLAAVACAFALAAPGKRLVYVMTDGAALPFVLSDLAAHLRSGGLIASSVSCGQAFGADLEAVNTLSGLDVARAVGRADAVVVAPGPGTVGTGTALGHGAVEGAALVDMAARRGASVVVALRWSDVDPRPRHRGLSHHSAAVLELAREWSRVPVPRGQPRPEVAGAHAVVEVDVGDVVAMLDAAGVAVTSMGRTPGEDPRFHAYAAAAGVLAAALTSSP